MYKYEEFKTVLKEEVERRLEGTGIQVLIGTVTKNNGQEKAVMTFKHIDFNIMPSIHLVEFYNHYENHEDMKEMVEGVLEILDTKGNMDIKELIGEWESKKRQLAMKLVHTEWNKEFLETVPHRMVVENLALVPYLKVKEGEDYLASIVVTYDVLKLWNISEESLLKVAYENLCEEQYVIEDMQKVIAELLGEELALQEVGDAGKLFVISNRNRSYGACAIARMDLMQEFAKEHGSFYILPSSVHECILLPESTANDVTELKAMVREINQSQVSPEERLSDDVYFYDSEAQKLIMK